MTLHTRTGMTSIAVLLLLSACGGGGGGGGGGDTAAGESEARVGVNGTSLFVSAPDLYYSTVGIGDMTTQTLELQNRGGDRYPLEEIRVVGSDADAFRVPIYGDVVLEPAQAIRIPITFEPLSNGRKEAAFEVDFHTIRLVDESVNIQERTYYEAADLARDGEYRESAERFGDYLASKPVIDVNKRRAALRMPVVQEAEVYAEGRDATLYLDALAARDREDTEDALFVLDTLIQLEADSYLADDAQYLKGYIALMDMNDPRLALREFKLLVDTYPDSNYYDTAQYGRALAQQQLGNDLLAYELLEDLKTRHTGLSALGVDLPKDDLVSRLWFDRANTAMESLRESGTAT